MKGSRHRRLEALETQLPPAEGIVSEGAVSRAFDRLQQESPHDLWLVENLILKHARLQDGVAIPYTGTENLEPTDEELMAMECLNEFILEETQREQ